MRNRSLLMFSALLSTSLVFGQVDVLTQHNDNLRSGLDTHETALNHQSVHTKFGKLWTLFSDAKIMAQPLYVSNLKSARCPAGCNTVIFASMKGTVYAYMADQKPATQNDTLVWARYIGDPRDGGNDFDMWAVDDPWTGILSTPVIDRATNSIYVVVWNKDDLYRLYNIELSTGNIKQGPVVIDGAIAGERFISSGSTQLRKQRAALLLSNGALYVGFGGDSASGLAGWMFVYDAATLAQKTVWSPTPGGRNGGIWQSGQGPAADAAGNVYLQVGDGEQDPHNQRFGDSLVKLRLEGSSLKVVDFFTPCTQMFLSKCDLDEGSSGPVLFEDSVVVGGKAGRLYLMRSDKLAGYQPGPFPPPANACAHIPDCQDGPNLVQKWQAAMGHIHGSPVFWKGPGGKSWLYVMGEGSRLQAFPFVNGSFDLNGVKQGKHVPGNPEPPPCFGPVMHWMPGGIISVSSDGDKPGTGIVWVLVPSNGDANSYRGVKGMLLAVDAEDASHELWRSQAEDPGRNDTPDSLGLLSRFVPPTVANGKVFIATAGDKEPIFRWCPPNRPKTFPQNFGLVVYGLKP